MEALTKKKKGEGYRVREMVIWILLAIRSTLEFLGVLSFLQTFAELKRKFLAFRVKFFFLIRN